MGNNKKFAGAPENPVCRITVAGFVNEGASMLEITKTDFGYIALVADTSAYGPYADSIDGMYERRREVFCKTDFSEKPTAEQVHSWLQNNRWHLFHIKAGTVQALLDALP